MIIYQLLLLCRLKERINHVYKWSSDDKILSSLIEKQITCTFLNHFRKAMSNNYVPCFNSIDFMYRTSLFTAFNFLLPFQYLWMCILVNWVQLQENCTTLIKFCICGLVDIFRGHPWRKAWWIILFFAETWSIKIRVLTIIIVTFALIFELYFSRFCDSLKKRNTF